MPLVLCCYDAKIALRSNFPLIGWLHVLHVHIGTSWGGTFCPWASSHLRNGKKKIWHYPIQLYLPSTLKTTEVDQSAVQKKIIHHK